MGGPAGKVGFPAYLEFYHRNLLGVDGNSTPAWDNGYGTYMFRHWLESALDAGSSPYTGASAFEPDEDLQDVQDRLDMFEALVQAQDPTTDWQNFSNTAFVAAEILFGTDSDINAEADAFEQAQLPSFMRSVSRMTGGMADINAVMGSAFVLGLAGMERDFQSQVSAYRSKVLLDKKASRVQFIANSVDEMVRLQGLLYDTHRAATAMQAEVSKAHILAKTDEQEQNLEYDIQDAQWELSLFKHAGSMLSAISGIPTVPPQLTKRQQALSTALTLGGIGLQAFAAFG